MSKELLKKGAIPPTAKAVGFLATKQMNLIELTQRILIELFSYKPKTFIIEIQKVSKSLPVNKEDEDIVDDLMRESTKNLKSRSL